MNTKPTELFDALLRKPKESATSLATEPTSSSILWLAGAALGSMAIYGLVLGLFSGGTQIWAAPLKLTIGLLFAAVICFPSLCILGALAGSEATPRGNLAVLCGGLALCGLLLLGFAPVLWVFSQSTESLGFFGFLGIAIWLASVLLGLGFILRGLRGTTARGFAPLTLWASVFLLVALQMTSALRPIIGTSEAFLPTEKRFFIEHWIVASSSRSKDSPRQTYSDVEPEKRGEANAKPDETTNKQGENSKPGENAKPMDDSTPSPWGRSN